MKEACFCGRVQDLEDREPVLGQDGERALWCSGCGHLDYLRWLPEDARLHVLEEADKRHPGSVRYAGRHAS